MDKITVAWEHTIFPRNNNNNSNNDFKIVAAITLEEIRIILVGNNLPEKKGIFYVFEGDFETGKHGRQFRVKNFSLMPTNTPMGVVNYLGSGVLKGIGPKTAQAIYDIFGDGCLDVLENSPEKLLLVKGITQGKLPEIIEGYIKTKGMDSLFSFLTKHKINGKTCKLLFEKYGEKALGLITDDVFILFSEFQTPFTATNRIAIVEDIGVFSSSRIDAAIIYTLRDLIVRNGHVYSSYKDCVKQCMLLLNAGVEDGQQISSLDIREGVKRLIRDNKVVHTQTPSDHRLYCFDHYHQESEIVRIIKELLLAKPPSFSRDSIEGALDATEEELKIDLSDKQREAVLCSLTNNVSIITGGAGTGKTTVQNALIRTYEKLTMGLVALTAPTGRAARLMSERTQKPANTLHSYLGLRADFSDYQGITVCNSDFVVADESSMVELSMFYRLLKSLKGNTKIVLIGDHNQLEPVGMGCVFKDLIESGVIPLTLLDTVYRQDEDSVIVANSVKINSGNSDFIFNDDFVFIQQKTDENVALSIVEAYIKAISEKGCDKVQIISPLKEKGVLSVNMLNERIQQAINPNQKGISVNGICLSVNDKVIQQRNDDDVKNGDMGYVIGITTRERVTALLIEFETGFSTTYTKEDLLEKNVTLAYAITVHKSQGSEFETILMPMVEQHKFMLRRNLFYTSITRAKQNVVLVGDKNLIKYAVNNNVSQKRNSALKNKLLALVEENSIDLHRDECEQISFGKTLHNSVS